MFKIYLALFVICVTGGINAQYELDELCVTDDFKNGVCKYEQTCKFARELILKEIHPSICSYEGRTAIVCCPDDYTSGYLSRYFEDTNGIINNDNLTCHYDGYLPMFCCPTAKNFKQPPEPRGCPSLTRIKTPKFSNPTDRVVWEKCVANQRYVKVCGQEGNSFKRIETCSIPVTAQRVSGGEPAAPNEFPHMAVLGCDNGIATESDIVWIGGGSLISETYILTAAHVLAGSSNGQIRYALLGSLDKTDVRGGDLYHLIRLIPHKLYSSGNKYHDIALVELNRPVVFNEHIRPICLPGQHINPEDTTRLIAGWGQTAYKSSTSNLLQKAIIAEVDGDECNSSLSWPDFVWNDATMICANGWKSRFGTTDSCQGDSGGPLMYKVTNKEFSCNYVVAGVVSWGGVCSTGTPASYTRISAYLDWIVATVWPEELRIASD